MVLIYPMGSWPAVGNAHPWIEATGQASLQISSALFLASLSPLRFRVGRFQVLYVTPYTIPIVICSFLAFGYFHGVTPSGLALFLFPALGAISLFVAFAWDATRALCRAGSALPTAPWLAARFSGFALSPVRLRR